MTKFLNNIFLSMLFLAQLQQTAESAPVLLGPPPMDESCRVANLCAKVCRFFKSLISDLRPPILEGIPMPGFGRWVLNDKGNLQTEGSNGYGFIEMIAGGYTFEIRISAKLQTSDHLAFRASNYLQHFPELTGVEGVSTTFKETILVDELGYLGDLTIIFNSQTVSPYDDPQAITDLVRQTVFKIANPSEAAPSNSSILSPDNRQRRIETGNPYQPTSIE